MAFEEGDDLTQRIVKYSSPAVVACLLAAVVVSSGCGKKSGKETQPGTAVQTEQSSAGNTNTVVSWKNFRGSDQGRAGRNERPPRTWSEQENVRWKTEIPGAGVSSPVMDAETIWLTSATEGERSLRVIGVNKETGAVLLNEEVFQLAGTPQRHRVNSPASPTPVLEDDRLYLSFGTHGLACFSISEKRILWKNQELKFDDEQMGPGASPVLAGDVMVVSCDGTDQRFIAGVDKRTGRILWKTERSNEIKRAIPFRKAFSTPLYRELNGERQIISSSSYRVFGYEPSSGNELWSVEIPGFCPVPVPAVVGNRIFVCTGYNKPELWAFEFAPSEKEPERIWKMNRSVPFVASPVVVNGYIYMVSQEGIASCVEAESGDIVWNERVGGAFWASPLHVDGHIYYFAENGVTTCVAEGKEFKIVSKNTLEGEIYATPAPAENSFFIRTKTHLYRIGGNEKNEK